MVISQIHHLSMTDFEYLLIKIRKFRNRLKRFLVFFNLRFEPGSNFFGWFGVHFAYTAGDMQISVMTCQPSSVDRMEDSKSPSCYFS